MLFGDVTIARYDWSKNPEQRTVQNFSVFLMVRFSVGKWCIGIIRARAMFATAPASRSFGLDEVHGMDLVRRARGKGPAAPALALAS